jgi:NarL family two-component system response regulator LiaR
MPNKVIRVLIVDDHPQVRRGLSVFLELWDDLKLVGEAENGKQAIELVAQLRPDVILMDLLMPVMDGIIATRAIKKAFPQVQIVVLTSTVDFDLVKEALQAGAYSYMFKTVSIDQMADTIRAAAYHSS